MLVLVTGDHTCSFTENRIPGKLEQMLSDMPGITLFSLFISHMIASAPTESHIRTCIINLFLVIFADSCALSSS